MEKLRSTLALLFLTEAIVALMHLVAVIFSEKDFPIDMYWMAPIFIIVIILFEILIAPILSWIAGD